MFFPQRVPPAAPGQPPTKVFSCAPWSRQPFRPRQSDGGLAVAGQHAGKLVPARNRPQVPPPAVENNAATQRQPFLMPGHKRQAQQGRPPADKATLSHVVRKLCPIAQRSPVAPAPVRQARVNRATCPLRRPRAAFPGMKRTPASRCALMQQRGNAAPRYAPLPVESYGRRIARRRNGSEGQSSWLALPAVIFAACTAFKTSGRSARRRVPVRPVARPVPLGVCLIEGGFFETPRQACGVGLVLRVRKRPARSASVSERPQGSKILNARPVFDVLPPNARRSTLPHRRVTAASPTPKRQGV